MLAASMRLKEEIIGVIANGFSLSFNMENKTKNEIIPEIEVARAMPASFILNIKAKFRTTFIHNAKNETFVGVSVSFSAKKQDWVIFVAP